MTDDLPGIADVPELPEAMARYRMAARSFDEGSIDIESLIAELSLLVISVARQTQATASIADQTVDFLGELTQAVRRLSR